MGNQLKFDCHEVEFVLQEAKLRMKINKGINIATALLSAGRCFPSTPYAAVYLVGQLSVEALYSTDTNLIEVLRKHPEVHALCQKPS